MRPDLSSDAPNAPPPTREALERGFTLAFDAFMARAKAEEQWMLLLVALVGPAGHQALIRQLENTAQLMGARFSPNRKRALAILKVLRQAQVVIYGYDQYRCQPFVRQLTIRAAHRKGIDLRRLVAAVSAHSYHFDALQFRRFDLAIVENDVATVERAFQDHYSPPDEKALVTLSEPFDAEWFAERREVFAVLLPRALDVAVTRAEPLGSLYPWLVRHVEEPAPWVDRRLLRLALANLALLRGDRTTLDTQIRGFGTTSDAAALRGARALTDGDFEASRTAFDEALAGYAVKTPVLPGLTAVFHILSLIERGSAADLDLARRTAHALDRAPGHPFAGAGKYLRHMILTLGDPRHAQDASARRKPAKRPHCLELLLQGLYATWFPPAHPGVLFELIGALAEREALSDAAEARWLTNQLRALRAELGKLLPQPRHVVARVADSAQQFARLVARVPDLVKPDAVPETPLLRLVRRKQPWELTLEELESALGTTEGAVDGTNARGERLSWRIAPPQTTLEPILHKRTNAEWSRGRAIALKELLPGTKHYENLGEADRRVVAHLKRESERGWSRRVNEWYEFGPGALAALVGHPHVYIPPDLDRPVQVVRGEVRLKVTTEGGCLVLGIEPTEVLGRPLLRRRGQRVEVYLLDADQRDLAQRLGPRLSIPETGKARALDLVTRLSSHFAVESSAALRARSVSPDSTPTLRLTPRGAGLDVAAGVRPLGEEGPFVAIAQGSPTVMASIAGTPTVTERDLGAELDRFAALQAQCPALVDDASEQGSWSLLNPYACLDLVSQLREVGDAVRVEWPSGKRFQLRCRVDRQALRGSVKHDAGWYLASGRIEHDGLELELARLLELFAAQPGRFVKLGDDEYLELADSLQALLESMSQSAEVRRSKRKAVVALPPAAMDTLDRLTNEAEGGLKLDAGTRAWRERVEAVFAARYEVPATLTAQFRDYQLEGYRWLARLAELGFGACLADDMGLGKTVQILALLLRRVRQGPALIVAPTSVCDNWHREARRFAPSLETIDYRGSGRNKRLGKLRKRDVIVTSYALLQQDAEVLGAVSWGTAVLDEAQFIKNAQTRRAKAAFALQAKVRIAATGTPVENRLGDLWSIFRFLEPTLLGSWKRFTDRFGEAAGSESPGVGETRQRSRQRLRRLVSPFVLRRTKSQVLEDLPPITEIQHTVELSAPEMALYETHRQRTLQQLKATDGSPQGRLTILAELTRLRRLCCDPSLVAPEVALSSSKLDAFVELAVELTEANHRALVFSQFVDFLERARERLELRGLSYQYLDGSTPAKQRAARVDAFQAGEGQFFLISLKAGGFGLNLTGADYVVHLDPWWNPAAEQQASDRAHRIGQTRPVTVYRLVAANTVEERIVELHRSKRELADSLLQGADVAARLTGEDLAQLLVEGRDGGEG